MQLFEHTLAKSGLGKLRLAKPRITAEKLILCTEHKDIH